MRNFEGQIRKVRFPYYDAKTKKMKYKARPFLLVKREPGDYTNMSDYTGLPISRITNSIHVSLMYDYIIEEENFPVCNLTSFPSYVRCHKISNVSSKQIDSVGNCICDFNIHYPEELNEIKELVKRYIATI